MQFGNNSKLGHQDGDNCKQLKKKNVARKFHILNNFIRMKENRKRKQNEGRMKRAKNGESESGRARTGGRKNNKKENVEARRSE